MSYKDAAKPEVPTGMRLLAAGEKVQAGDWKYFPEMKKWLEVSVSDMQVRSRQSGFYCSKVAQTSEK